MCTFYNTVSFSIFIDYPVLYDRLATTSQKCKKKDQIQTKKNEIYVCYMLKNCSRLDSTQREGILFANHIQCFVFQMLVS